MSQSIRQQRTYDAEFKREAVLLVTEKGRSCPDVAAALGIPLGTLYKWVEEYKKHRVDLFPGCIRIPGCGYVTVDGEGGQQDAFSSPTERPGGSFRDNSLWVFIVVMLYWRGEQMVLMFSIVSGKSSLMNSRCLEMPK